MVNSPSTEPTPNGPNINTLRQKELVAPKEIERFLTEFIENPTFSDQTASRNTPAPRRGSENNDFQSLELLIQLLESELVADLPFKPTLEADTQTSLNLSHTLPSSFSNASADTFSVDSSHIPEWKQLVTSYHDVADLFYGITDSNNIDAAVDAYFDIPEGLEVTIAHRAPDATPGERDTVAVQYETRSVRDLILDDLVINYDLQDDSVPQGDGAEIPEQNENMGIFLYKLSEREGVDSDLLTDLEERLNIDLVEEFPSFLTASGDT